MPTFYKIDEVKSQWNRNLLPIDLFKLELVTDKKWEIPSYYTKPGE